MYNVDNQLIIIY